MNVVINPGAYEPHPHRRLYATSVWKAMRMAQLNAHPLCIMCEQAGTVTAAKVADHIIPHKGDSALFYDASNLQSLCKTHHDSSKHRDEVRGYTGGCGLDGVPIDPNHHWYR